jgi:Cu-Zn family superoxide dismutase
MKSALFFLVASLLSMAGNVQAKKKCSKTTTTPTPTPTRTTCPEHDSFNTRKKAVAILTGSATIKGNVTFSQENHSLPISIQVSLVGLPPGRTHGFHIHTFGDISGGCASTGGHYNPFNKTHGAPNAEIRHVGDLGNVVANYDGSVSVVLTDSKISLYGLYSVLGRGVVLHNGTDDLGLGGHSLSLTTGNAGARLACGVIGISNSTI